MEALKMLEEKEKEIITNSLDFFSNRKITLNYISSSGSEFVDRILKEQEDKFFPMGSIEEKLKEVSNDTYVDLGLSVKWSSKNIGASKMYELGYYFRWGSLEHLETYDRKDRKKMLMYSKIPYSKEIEKLEYDISGNPKYDAANKFSNGIERLPTKAECEELIELCKWEYIEIDKYKGHIVTGPSGQSIYIPLAYQSFVNRDYEVLMIVEEAYLTSTPEQEDEYCVEDLSAYCLRIANKNHRTEEFTIGVSSFFKERFCLIRGVC